MGETLFVSASVISEFRGAMQDFNDSEKSSEIISSRSWLKPTGASKGETVVAILGFYPSTLRARTHKLGVVGPETREPDYWLYGGGLIHLLLVVAIVVVLIRVIQGRR
jgi:Family of unknown function (DUF5670)